MKKIYLTLSITLASFLINAQNPILNPGFETWTNQGTYDNCNNWGNYNDLFVSIGFTPLIFKSTDKHSGNFSSEMRTVDVMGDVGSGSVFTGNLDVVNNVFVPNMKVTKVHDSLQFWYKYSPVNSDSFGVIVFYSKWNTVTSTRDVGSSTLFSSGGNVSNWTKMKIKLTENSSFVPDSCLIVFSSSNGGLDFSSNPISAGTSLKIDDISFTDADVVGLGNQAYLNQITNILNISPNPSNQSFEISNIPSNFKIRIYNLLGDVVFEEISISSKLLVSNTFLSGIYKVALFDENDKMIESKNHVISVN